MSSHSNSQFVWKWGQLERIILTLAPNLLSHRLSVSMKDFYTCNRQNIGAYIENNNSIGIREESDVLLVSFSWETPIISFYECLRDYMRIEYGEQAENKSIWTELLAVYDGDPTDPFQSQMDSLRSIIERRHALKISNIVIQPIWQDIDIYFNPVAMATLMVSSETPCIASTLENTMDMLRVIAVDVSVVVNMVTRHINAYSYYEHPVFGDINLHSVMQELNLVLTGEIQSIEDSPTYLHTLQRKLLKAHWQLTQDVKIQEEIIAGTRFRSLADAVQIAHQYFSREFADSNLETSNMSPQLVSSSPPETSFHSSLAMVFSTPTAAATTFNSASNRSASSIGDRSDSSLSSSTPQSQWPTPHETALHTRLQEAQARYGPYNPATLSIIQELANLYASSVRFELSDRYYEEYLHGMTALYGPTHPQTIQFLHNFTDFNLSRREYHRASELYEMLLKAQLDFYHQHVHPAMLFAAGELSNIFFLTKVYDKALHYATLCISWSQRLYGRNHTMTELYQRNLNRLEVFAHSSSSSSSFSASSSPSVASTSLSSPSSSSMHPSLPPPPPSAVDIMHTNTMVPSSASYFVHTNTTTDIQTVSDSLLTTAVSAPSFSSFHHDADEAKESSSTSIVLQSSSDALSGSHQPAEPAQYHDDDNDDAFIPLQPRLLLLRDESSSLDSGSSASVSSLTNPNIHSALLLLPSLSTMSSSTVSSANNSVDANERV